jgi:hypothetical protein
MIVKCPKCRFRFDVSASPGMTEVQCNCPRCGTPFTYSLAVDDDTHAGEGRPTETPTTSASSQPVGTGAGQVQPGAPSTSDTARPETPSGAGMSQPVPPPVRPSGYNQSVPPVTPPPYRARQRYVPPTPAHPVAERKQSPSCLMKMLIGALVVIVPILLFVFTCDSPSDNEPDESGMTINKANQTMQASTVVQDQPFNKRQGPQEAPEWIQGNWHIDTDYGGINLNISGDRITESTNGETVSGRFKYQNHIIYGEFGDEGGFNYKVIEETHQIDCGDGMLMSKVE